MSGVSLGVSFCAFVFSIFTFCYKNSLDRKKSKTDKITKDYLDFFVQEIPKSYSKINLLAQNDGVAEFTEAISELKLKIKIIEILDEHTYEDWSRQLMDIEDFIIDESNRPLSSMTKEKENFVLEELKQKLKKLYETILTEKYSKIPY